MRLGYNTNGLAHHRWQDALELLAGFGYQSVALTLDHHLLDPYHTTAKELEQVRQTLERLRLSCVIETGARFLLDRAFKHEPTLLHADPAQREIRIDFLKRSIDIAHALHADAVSFWSGILRDDISYGAAFDRLVGGSQKVLEYAEHKQVRLAFEPEPGMLIETMDQFAELKAHFPSPMFGLTIDIGHLQCVESPPLERFLTAWKDILYNIHIEDMKTGIHDHLRFGEGDIDFTPIFQTLKQIDYQFGLHVELSRHSHEAPAVSAESMAFLRQMLDN